MKLTFIESRGFTEKLATLIADDAYRAFQNELQENPEKGDVIQGTGGVRKVRMRLSGRGKSGGARVIYLFLENHARIYLLTLYSKNQQVNLSSDQKKEVRKTVETIKAALGD
jgi:hypothetical protein